MRRKEDMFRQNRLDMIPQTNGFADIEMDVSAHVETVCCLYHQKKDFIKVLYDAKDEEYLK